MSAIPPVLELRGATCTRPRAAAVGPQSIAVGAGEVCALMGPSGSGKSTLLALLAGVERVDSGAGGSVWWWGRDVTRASESALALLRRGSLGVVGQSYGMLEHLPLWRGVALGLLAQGVPAKEQRERALQALAELGLEGSLALRLPRELSGGERQRAAVARALLTAGRALIADEPTSNQDPANAERVAQALRRRARAGVAVVLSTHDPLLSSLADRCLRLGG